MPFVQTESGSIIAEGKDAVNVFACLAVAQGLRFYAKTGMKINSAYSPSTMLKFVERTTGRKFKRGQYVEAAECLKEYADEAAKSHRRNR